MVEARLKHAVEFARKAGECTVRHFHNLPNLKVDAKADRSPVTAADRESELLLRELIGKAYPDDGIVGEEYPEKEGTSGFRWVLDPIDGTKSFICGVPLYGTLVGILQQDTCVVGVIEMGALDRRVYAMRGGMAWQQQGNEAPARAQVRACENLEDAVFVTTERASFDPRGAAEIYSKLEATCRITRTWGDCYGYYLVATGKADLMVDPVMNLWDAAAILPVIEGAGGVFVDWQGRVTPANGDGLATTRELLPKVMAYLQG
jgi:histidinol-phosphatase